MAWNSAVNLYPARFRVAATAITALLGMAAATPAALAASQGAVGATATGTVEISASVPPRARLSGLTNVTFANVNSASNARNAQNVCAWSNTPTRGYRITASGSGTGNAFTLSAGMLKVPYTVQWNGTSGRTTGSALNAGTQSGGFVSAATHQQCASGPSASASLIITISAANLQTMQPAVTYTGALTLLMTPQ